MLPAATHSQHRPRMMRGVTLMELLIAMVIVGILATIAYPNYRNYIERAKRTEARAVLLEIAVNQERYYLNANRYATLAELGYPNPLVTDSGAYTVTVPVNDFSNYSIIATYNDAGKEYDRCSSFSIDARGNKTSTGSIANCWTDQR